jgi:hypothetical protein
MMRRLLALLAVAVLFLAGCGDDGGGSTDTGSASGTAETTEGPEDTEPPETEPEEEAMALDEWAEEADAICAESSDAIDELGEPQSAEEMVDLLPELIEIAEGELEAIDELGLPDESADAAEELLDIRREQLDLIQGAVDAIDEGDDPEEVMTDLLTAAEAMDDEAADLADELGLEECGPESGGTTEPTTPDTMGTDGEPFTYGDDPDLDALWDACEDGDMASCDELFFASPIDSEYELFGNTCGDLFTEDEAPVFCEDAITDDGDEPFTYGDDPDLDALWDACEGGNGTACDQLFWDSPIDSEYETFGNTCGGLFDEDEVPLSCEEEIGGEKVEEETIEGSSYGDDPVLDALWDKCDGGDMVACDELFWTSPVDSEYETFGNTCGGRFSEDEVPFSCEAGE